MVAQVTIIVLSVVVKQVSLSVFLVKPKMIIQKWLIRKVELAGSKMNILAVLQVLESPYLNCKIH